MTAVQRFVRTPATWYGYFLIGTQIYLFNVQGNVIPFLQTEFTLSYRIVSLHSSAMALGVIITGLFGHHVTRRLSRATALRLGGGGMATGALLLCLSPGPWASLPSCLIMGLLGALIPSVVPAVLTDIHGEGRRQAFAEQAIVAYTFAIVGPLATGFFVANGLGWRPAVLIGAGLGFALIAFFRNIAMPEQRPATQVTAARLPPPFWAYWCLVAFSCSLEFSILLWAPSFLQRVVGLPAAEAATAAAGFFVGVLAGRIALRALVQKLQPRTILFSAFATGAVGFILYWGVGQPWAAIAGIVMLGLCIAPAISAHHGPRHRRRQRRERCRRGTHDSGLRSCRAARAGAPRRARRRRRPALRAPDAAGADRAGVRELSRRRNAGTARYGAGVSAFAMAGFSRISTASSVSGPMILSRMMPSGPTRNVSGTP